MRNGVGAADAAEWAGHLPRRRLAAALAVLAELAELLAMAALKGAATRAVQLCETEINRARGEYGRRFQRVVNARSRMR